MDGRRCQRINLSSVQSVLSIRMVSLMQNPLSYYAMLARRWLWLILLGVALCGGGTFIASKLSRPVYQAAAFLSVDFQSSTSPYENTTASLTIVPTYTKYITNPAILSPIVALHPGMTLPQLTGMIVVNQVPNTTLIELDVDNSNPQLAAQLANEVGQQFAEYANTQLPAVIHIVPAVEPTTPIRPKPSTYGLIGALVGLGLAIALIVIFEWIDDRLSRPDEVQELLGL